MQKMADQVAKYFVPAIVIIAIAAGFGWYFAGHIGLTFSVLAFVSVMIIACPCAMGIATPAALMMGSGKGAENGILFKGGEYLEAARKINTVVFDKTGTLTKGKPEVTDVIDLSDKVGDGKENDVGNGELLRLAAIAESGSEHPLGQAVVGKAKQKGIVVANPESFEAVSGHGLRARYAGHTILIGNRKLMDDNKIAVTEHILLNRFYSWCTNLNFPCNLSEGFSTILHQRIHNCQIYLVKYSIQYDLVSNMICTFLFICPNNNL
jgi:Cu+-exporting ATPase